MGARCPTRPSATTDILALSLSQTLGVVEAVAVDEAALTVGAVDGDGEEHEAVVAEFRLVGKVAELEAERSASLRKKSNSVTMRPGAVRRRLLGVALAA